MSATDNSNGDHVLGSTSTGLRRATATSSVTDRWIPFLDGILGQDSFWRVQMLMKKEEGRGGRQH